MSTASLTSDTTLYAKWVKPDVVKHTVTYTLLWEPDPADTTDTGSYSESYKVEQGAYAYDPTNDLYAIAGKDLLAAYELQKSGDSCWFTSNNNGVLSQPFNFETAISEDTHLYAKVVDRQYTVTYFNGSEKLGTQSVAYNKPIGTLGIAEPTKTGYRFSGWVTENNVPWNISSDTVTSDMKLYASWPEDQWYSVTFDANGQGTAPEKQTVKDNGQATEPRALKADGYTFGGWFTDKACTTAYNFATPVTDNMTLYAKWTKNAEPVTPTEPTTPDVTPDAVAITSVKSPLKCKVEVKWGAANNADGYEVSVNGIITSVDSSKNSVSVVNTKLKAGKEYDVKVRAWHMNGTAKTYGSWSAAKKVTISKYYNAKAKKKVKAYKKASTKSKKKAKLKKGATVKVLKVKGKWAQTNKGWVLKKNLKAVKIVNTPTVAAQAVSPAAESTPSAFASSLMAARIG